MVPENEIAGPHKEEMPEDSPPVFVEQDGGAPTTANAPQDAPVLDCDPDERWRYSIDEWRMMQAILGRTTK